VGISVVAFVFIKVNELGFVSLSRFVKVVVKDLLARDQKKTDEKLPLSAGGAETIMNEEADEGSRLRG